MLAGALLAAVFAFFALVLHANQYATGLRSRCSHRASAFIGLPYSGQGCRRAARRHRRAARPAACRPVLFGHHPLVYVALLLCWGGMDAVPHACRAGAARGGESPESAHAVGIPVRGVRLAALLFGAPAPSGARTSPPSTRRCCGEHDRRPWLDRAGAVVFATWRPLRVLVGAYLFGGVTMLQLYLQGIGVQAPSQLMSMAPYLATIVVLALISRNPAGSG